MKGVSEFTAVAAGNHRFHSILEGFGRQVDAAFGVEGELLLSQEAAASLNFQVGARAVQQR